MHLMLFNIKVIVVSTHSVCVTCFNAYMYLEGLVERGHGCKIKLLGEILA